MEVQEAIEAIYPENFADSRGKLDSGAQCTGGARPGVQLAGLGIGSDRASPGSARSGRTEPRVSRRHSRTIRNMCSRKPPAHILPSRSEGLDKETLRLARNEICARHGKMFRDAELRAYFESKSWYSGTIEADAFDRLTNIYNAYEVANIALIQKYEAM